jgi:SAM-dependent methyltransferase
MLTALSPADDVVMTTTDLVKDQQLKDQQRAGWSAQAQQWYAQLDVTERQWGPISDGLLKLARVGPGDRVLDLACGIGDPAIAAALLAGPTGRVIATDISPDMLAFAAQRAAAAGLSNLDTHEMDAEDIDLPDGSVDVVLCRLGLMFLPNLDKAIAGVHRVLVPGGRFAAAMPWRPKNQPLPRLVGAMTEALDLPPQPPAEPGRPGIFSLADASFICTAMEDAGFNAIRVVPYTLRHDYRSPAEWIDAVLALNAPLRQMLAGVPAERLQEGRNAAMEAAKAYQQADGHVRFPAYGYYAEATR